jgi:arylsulfatase A
MKLYSFLLLFTVALGSHAQKPNVVLFLVDDMGWMDCGIYGSKYYETPHMDKLAKQSMLFTGASEKVSAAGGCHFQLR